ncbi:MAG: hypothetical protein HN742_29395 [Lentisphaerae bacterium]|nr:hypothetical protein [Lentisphaerota bacterium]
MVLSSVSVRVGKILRIYDAGKLIPVRVTHFSSKASLVAMTPEGYPLGPRPATDLLDNVLNSGILNPDAGDGKALPADTAERFPGLGVRFSRPVINRAGPDIVLFEVHTHVSSPVAGDPFLLHALPPRAGGHPLRVERFDLTVAEDVSRAVLPGGLFRPVSPPTSLAELSRHGLRPAGTTAFMPFRIIAVAVDLTDAGVVAGGSVDGLVLQNVPERSNAAVDFVCVAGLPAPEPSNLLAREPPIRKAPPKPILPSMLAEPLAEVEEVVFAVRMPGTDHWYANFGFYSAPRGEYPPQRASGGKLALRPIYKKGGALRALDLRARTVRSLVEDREGAIRDPCVHYDGRTIVFSWRKAGSDFYHLYEIQKDGTGVRQLTTGPHNDIEPTFLPDGGLMFCSDRCNRFVNCWITPVASLYRCNRAGTEIRMISSNVEHDNTPWMLPDGRVLYMRWEYVDRNQSTYHHLWTANPDGTGQMVYYGNLHPGLAMLDAKAVPGTRRVVASFSPGHGRAEHAGHVTLIDPRHGPDHRGSARRISRGGAIFRDPFALSDACFLVAADRRLLVMDDRGRTSTVHELGKVDAGCWLHEPRPLVQRPTEPRIPPRVTLQEATGTFFLSDVTAGRTMGGVEAGEITHLLVLQQMPKPVNFSGGMWPISAGGTFTLARILGTVPVRPDGSALFRAPALQSLFFVALDRAGLSVKRMQSFVTLQPGEQVGCVGCHESRVTAPGHARPKALPGEREPDAITPISGAPDVPDFPRDMQPILDRHCVRCHNPKDYKGKVDLCGDRTPLFSQAYWQLTQRGLYSDGRNEARSNYPPRTIGSSASRILTLMDGSHRGAKTNAEEKRIVRLWIDAGAPFAGTYAALGSGMSPVVFPEEAVKRRCASCHGRKPKGSAIGGRDVYFQFGRKGPALPLVHTFRHLRDIRARTGYYKFGSSRTPQSLCNLSRPEFSLILRVHLARSAGGLELGGKRIFESVEDPDYQAILTAVREASGRLGEEKRFDMPGFRPNDYYLHQLTRYGVLPEPLAAGPLDPYVLDRKYWRSFESRVAGRDRGRGERD